jgi:hypothetical protein
MARSYQDEHPWTNNAQQGADLSQAGLIRAFLADKLAVMDLGIVSKM